MKIAIAGYGVEGRASFEYWNRPDNNLTIADEREHIEVPQDVQTVLGPDAFSHLGDYELIIRSPSVSPKKLPYGDKVWTATNEFFAKCPAVIIGVTGTKGKGTTCSLIASILRAAGKTVHLVGNIGVPALEVLPGIQTEDVVVYELSSFQLWDAKKSPQVAVVLMIEPDHLEVHADMAEYVAAKANIAAHQSSNDVVIFNKDNQYARHIADMSPARKIEYPFAINEFVTSLKIPGKHNQENAAAAIAATREFDVGDDAIREGLSNFTGLPHRLKFVRVVGGVKYYDDSIATTPGSAIAAVNSFEERVVLILGGREKGADLTEFMQFCHDKQVSVIAIGENREQIAELAAKYDVECVVESGNMELIVQRAAMEAEAGSVVVLSPAAASFDMFKNYADRGEQFVKAVENL